LHSRPVYARQKGKSTMGKQMKLKPMIQASVAALAFIAAAQLAIADSFTIDKTEVHPGETVNLTFVADENRTDDVYVVIPWQGAYLFLNAQGAFVPYTPGTATPARFHNPTQGTHNVLSFVAPTGFYTSVNIYQARGTPGSDLLAGAGNYDATSLRSVALTFSPQTAVSSGKALYSTYCAICHGANPDVKARAGASNATKISSAIVTNKGGMAALATLPAAEISAIATWLANPV
jgi:mono/diheme cytochrome c family protein